jgi:hypothetical protein
MQFNPGGLVVAAVFYGLLIYALQHRMDAGSIERVVAAALFVAVGRLMWSTTVQSPLPWPRRRVRKTDEHGPHRGSRRITLVACGLLCLITILER